MSICVVALACILMGALPEDTAAARGFAVATDVGMARFPTPEAARRHDPWIAQDKAQHFAMSFAATAFSFAAARATLEPRPAAVAGATAAVVAGIGKEVHDARSGRWFSLRDMAWNLAGVGLGIVYVMQIR